MAERTATATTLVGSGSTTEAPTAPADLQARLARAYLSGNGGEVERLLALVAAADYRLPPKTDRAA